MPSATNIPSADIPVIDISSSNADAAAQVLAAAANNGFVFVENNSAGIPANDIENMFELVRLLAALTLGTETWRDRKLTD